MFEKTLPFSNRVWYHITKPNIRSENMFDIIKEHSHLVSFQANNAFLVNLWDVHQDCWVGVDHFPFKIIGVKASKGRHFSLQATFAVGFRFITRLVNLQIFFIFLKINSFDLIQNINCKIRHIFVFKHWILI